MTTSYYLSERGNLYRSDIHTMDQYPSRRDRRTSSRRALPSQTGRKNETHYGLWNVVVDIMGTMAIIGTCATIWLQFWTM